MPSKQNAATTANPRSKTAAACWQLLRLHNLHRNTHGATSLEWVLLLAGIALPSYWIIRIAFDTLIAHYEMAVTLNEIPFP